MLVNNDLIHPYGQLLSSHIDGRDYIFIDHFRRYPKPFAEDVEQRIPADETDQVLAAALRLRQRMFWRCGRFRKPNLRLAQSHLRCAPLQLGVAIPRVMFSFKDQRFSIQVLCPLHRHAAQEATAVMVIKLFHDPVAPRLGHRNKPKLYPLGQAKANQTAHPARMSMTAIENQLIIYLLMSWYAQTPPVRPDSVDRRLRGFIKDWRHRTAPGGYVHAVHAVEPQRSTQVTGTHIVALMYLIGVLAQQLRIALALRFVTSGAPMRQPFATYDSANGSQTRHRRNLHCLQLPTDRLCSAKQALVVEVQPRQLDCFNHFSRQLPRIAMRPPGLISLPMGSFAAGLIALNPLVDPRPTITKLLGNRRYRFAPQVRLNCMLSVALSFLFHAFLQKEKGADNQTSAPQPLKLTVLFQRTVFNVMAHRRVFDVVTLVI